MKQTSQERQDLLWHHLVDSHLAYTSARQEFFAPGTDRVGLIRKGLFLPHGENRATAISLLVQMSAAERLQLFPELIQLARAAHGPVGVIRDQIMALPRDWVIANIEHEVWPLLDREEYDDYWMFLELLELLDRDLALKLAHRAAISTEPDIREIGQEYLEKLLQTQSHARVT